MATSPRRIGPAVAPLEHQVRELLDRVAAGEAHRVLAAADVDESARHVVGAARHLRDARNLDAELGGARRVEHDLQLLVGAEVDAHVRDARESTRCGCGTIPRSGGGSCRSGPAVPGSSCTKNHDSVLLKPLPPSSPREICGACASRGSGGSWFMRLMTSSIVACMSVPDRELQVDERAAGVREGIERLHAAAGPASARSCGSMIWIRFRCGAAARQLVKMEITGSSMFGNSWIGSLTQREDAEQRHHEDGHQHARGIAKRSLGEIHLPCCPRVRMTPR